MTRLDHSPVSADDPRLTAALAENERLCRELDRLRAEFDEATVKRFEVLKSFLTDFRGTVSYQEAARLLGMTESAIKSATNRLRQCWRELMREEIDQILQVVTEKEVDEEVR